MCADRILVSPPGFDNVHEVLLRLGGQNASARQLTDSEMTRLRSPAFLSRTELLFLNCSGDLSNQAKDKAICQTIRDFVFGGGTLYASDWASEIVAAAFGDMADFGPKEGEAGTVAAKISDHYLALRLNYSIQLTFDLESWTRITRFPKSADFYITDATNNPLALGFMAGLGRVVFTSFHHHAQQAADEEKILDWLVRLPTQHRLLLITNQAQTQHRAGKRSQVAGTIAKGNQVIPVRTGQGSGLGVFSLSWDKDDRVEFGMRYLRDREIPVGDQVHSSTPPLVITVRNPTPRDGVEISKHVVAEDDAVLREAEPFVFAAGLRPDLLQDPDWLAAAVLRHLTGIFGTGMSRAVAREILSFDQMLRIVDTILSGLGYLTRGSEELTPEVLAWPLSATDGPPALRAGATVADRTDLPPEARPWIHPVPLEPNPATEYLLVGVALEAGRTDFDWVETEDSRRQLVLIRSPSEIIEWTPVASASGSLGHERETISDEEYRLNYHVDVTVYRADLRQSAGPTDAPVWR